MKIRHIAAHTALIVLAALAISGCGKIKNPFSRKAAPTPTPAPAAVATPAPHVAAATPPPATPAPVAAATPSPTPAAPPAPPIDKNAQVIVLCYHRLEGKAGGALSIEAALFERQMQEIKDRGLAVISMQDFMAWRRGEKGIPAKSVLITIDDGYLSGYEAGVPVLKKHGYPATFFIYTNYVNVGGKSMSWAQLAELRDQGYEIGSHTVSHQDLRRKPGKTKFADYDSWLKDELETSKRLLEEQLGIRVSTIAYPFGLHSPKVHETTRAAGYDLAFTTYGQRVGHSAAPYTIGRYDVTAKDAQGHDGFTAAISFQGPAAAAGVVMAQDAQVMMITEPINGAVISNPKPSLRANLSTLGALEPGSVEMRVSGFGLVPATYDATSKMISYDLQQPLRPGPVSVIVAGRAAGQRVETRWSFRFDPSAKPSDFPAPGDLPPRR
jgi:peptidoglycan/xylan/chitin deacetylase (PgdA/CDA1 family)